MSVTRAEAEALLFREARLLDKRRFREWLDMFADDEAASPSSRP